VQFHKFVVIFMTFCRIFMYSMLQDGRFREGGLGGVVHNSRVLLYRF